MFFSLFFMLLSCLALLSLFYFSSNCVLGCAGHRAGHLQHVGQGFSVCLALSRFLCLHLVLFWSLVFFLIFVYNSPCFLLFGFFFITSLLSVFQNHVFCFSFRALFLLAGGEQGTFNTFNKVTGSLGDTISQLSLDTDYRKRRVRERLVEVWKP